MPIKETVHLFWNWLESSACQVGNSRTAKLVEITWKNGHSAPPLSFYCILRETQKGSGRANRDFKPSKNIFYSSVYSSDVTWLADDWRMVDPTDLIPLTWRWVVWPPALWVKVWPEKHEQVHTVVGKKLCHGSRRQVLRSAAGLSGAQQYAEDAYLSI